jgi:hypothetical protein
MAGTTRLESATSAVTGWAYTSYLRLRFSTAAAKSLKGTVGTLRCGKSVGKNFRVATILRLGTYEPKDAPLTPSNVPKIPKIPNVPKLL